MFLAPWMLLTLLALPVILWLYIGLKTKRAASAVAYPDLITLLKANQKRKRTLFPLSLIYFLALLFAFVALARPTMPVAVANPEAGIVLAIDTSRSMRQADVIPSRFEAARAAVRSFLDELPQGVRVGLVNFGGYATLNVPLTQEHEQVADALERLYLIRGTAIGEALIKSLAAFPDLAERPVSGESNGLATVILLSDGRNRGGINPLDALEQLKAKDITVHTIGVGTNSANFNPDAFGGAFQFDEETLRTIAEQTGGAYVFVDSAADLNDVYKSLSHSIAWRMTRQEATALVTLLAALLLFLSLSLGQLKRQVI
ncbi:MAG: VWA domain-containing protein [Trueperaceae bacterium]|nr:VWA domain-containing protein [Trueperaceae bacterium]